MPSMFDSESLPGSREPLQEGAILLRGFVLAEAPALLEEVVQITPAALFRHLVTPDGYTMSVAMTNCGPCRLGIGCHRLPLRHKDPGTGAPWPPMPKPFLDLAMRAADEAGKRRPGERQFVGSIYSG